MASPKPHVRSGRRALEKGVPKQAVVHFSRALAVAPSDFDALSGIAEAYRALGRRIDSLRALDRIVASGRATAATWLAMAEGLGGVGEWAQALGAAERAVAMDAGSARAHHELAGTLYNLGEMDRAVAHFRAALELADATSSLASLATAIPNAPGASQDEILEARRALGTRLAEGSPLAGRSRPGPHGNRIPRIGYLSAHFHGENYMKPVWALLNHHDRSRFELHLLSDAREASLEFPGYRPRPEDRRHPVGNLSNEELADFIAAEGIDVLVDLGGYGVLRRLELFVAPLAPVVVTWFNSFATSGMPGIDGIIGDDETVWAGEEGFYTESVRRLPLSYLTFEVTHPVPPVVPPPCLSGEGLSFGSLVTQYKIVPEVIDAWSAILRGAPGSRLLLGNSFLKSRENGRWLLGKFAERGVDAERITLLPPADHLGFLGHYDRIDIALDAFPYNGGTTTMEAIWQGVPVLGFDGDRWASRTSQTLLRRSHLAEFVAGSVDGMVALACALAADPGTPERLAELRASMRGRLAGELLCDGSALAGSMEAIYIELLEERSGGSGG